jgi:hypothetical protein
MKCEMCGEVCQCPMEPPPIDSPIPERSIPETPSFLVDEADGAEGVGDWRNELSARLNHYRSRRKAPPPRYPSLRLPFGPATSALRVPTYEQEIRETSVVGAPDNSLVTDHRSRTDEAA